MMIFINKDGKEIVRIEDCWADKRDDCFIETFYGDDKINPSPESLKAAMNVRNKRKKELKEMGMNDITANRLVDDVRSCPPKTVAYEVSAFKK